MKRVEGKKSVVTDGALGIGRATYLQLAREGAKVSVTDIADEEGQKVVETIAEFCGIAKYWHVDTSEDDNISSAFSDIVYSVLYFASDESKFITGAELIIDGGYTRSIKFWAPARPKMQIHLTL